MHAFRAAVEKWDFDAIGNMLADDVVFYSPIAHKPYQEKFVVGMILATVSQIFENLTYEREIVGDGDAALIFRCQVDGLDLQGCDFIKTDEAGRIVEFMVMLRPLKAVLAFEAKMKVKFAEAMALMQANETG